VKPFLYALMLLIPCAVIALAGGFVVQWVFGKRRIPLVVHLIPPVIAVGAAVGVVFLIRQPALLEYMFPTRVWLDANHFAVIIVVMLVGLVALLWELRQWLADHGEGRSLLGMAMLVVLLASLAAGALAGVLVLLKIPFLDTLTRASYSVLDVALVVVLGAVIVSILHNVARQFGNQAGTSPAPPEPKEDTC